MKDENNTTIEDVNMGSDPVTTETESVTKEQESILYPDKGTTEDTTSASEPQSEEAEKVTSTEENTKESEEGKEEGEDKEEGKEEGKSEEIKYELKLPEEPIFDEETLGQIVEFAKENNLTPEAAQAVVESQDALIKDFIDATADHQENTLKEWRESVVSDPNMGGDNLNTTVEQARRAVDKFGSEEFTSLLRDSGYGDHPEMVRFLSGIGKLMSEDSLITSGQPASDNKTPEQIMYGSN